MYKEGDKVKDFTLADSNGKKISLSNFDGKMIVVYFYPKDNTPGCSEEACSFRDVYDDMLEKGAVVIGISADSVESHSRFRDKYDLPFHLLSDPEKKVIQQFGAWGEKKSGGETKMGIIRSTFILNKDKEVVKVFPKVKPAEHGDEILALL